MRLPRKPAAFRLEPEATLRPDHPAAAPRRAKALPKEALVVTADTVDAFDAPDVATSPPSPVGPPRRRFGLATLFASALGVLVSLTAALWMDRLVRALFERAEWLGWAAGAAAAIALIAALAILVREAAALVRLASLDRLRAEAADALSRDDAGEARKVVDALVALLASRSETAAGRRALRELRDDIIDGRDLIHLAEVELLSPLDREAKGMILDAAKRVSVVTAVSPRALVDIAYVVFEAGRLIRRLAELYGGRPGTLGFFRLARSVVAHLAVTGSIAVGDGIVQQIVGHGLAARLSARLGEGLVNGMMTARIGIAAMDVVRPLPFSALKRPGIGDFLAALSSFAKARVPETETS